MMSNPFSAMASAWASPQYLPSLGCTSYGEMPSSLPAPAARRHVRDVVFVRPARRRKGRSRREAARVFGLKMCRHSAPPGFSALIGVLPRKLSVGDALILILAYCRIEVAPSDCGPLYFALNVSAREIRRKPHRFMMRWFRLSWSEHFGGPPDVSHDSFTAPVMVAVPVASWPHRVPLFGPPRTPSHGRHHVLLFGSKMPRLFTKTSASVTCFRNASTQFAVPKSAATPRNSAFATRWRILSSAAATRASVRPLTTTLAPSAAGAVAIANPIPAVEPGPACRRYRSSLLRGIKSAKSS